MKQWLSILDDRETHKILGGEIREIEDYFEVNGHKAKYPGGFDVVSEDIYCRYCMGQSFLLKLLPNISVARIRVNLHEFSEGNGTICLLKEVK